MYLLIITIPFGKASFVIGNFCFLPFGKELISRKELTGKDDIGTGTLGLIGNIIWIIFAGVWLAIGHAIAGVLCFLTIIGIPFGVQHFKIAGACFAPIGAVVGEWIGGSQGLGSYMIYSNARLQIDNMFASLFVLIIITISLYHIIDLLLKKSIWWE